MNKIRAVFLNIAVILWTGFIAVAGIPLLIFSTPKALTWQIGRPWARGTLLLARLICNIRYELQDDCYILNGPAIYASKHQSAFEICVLLGHLPAPVFVLKRELLFLPLYGLYLWRMGMIAIDRKGGAASMKAMLRDAENVMRDMRPIIIFPEGTRTLPGTHNRYHPGVAAIYHHLKVPVVPVAVNTGAFWGRKKMQRYTGNATVLFKKPIEAGLSSRAFLKKLEAEIEPDSIRLYEEARQQLQDKEKTP